MKFKFLEHTADIKFQAFGKNLEEVFKNSALALKEIMSEDKVEGKIKKEVGVHIEGEDLEGVLYSFLEEFLILFETENFLWGKVKNMKIKEESGAYFINCDVEGDNSEKYEIGTHIKAITYNEMFIKKERNKFVAQVVVDV